MVTKPAQLFGQALFVNRMDNGAYYISLLSAGGPSSSPEYKALAKPSVGIVHN